jgi:very-short-patch-repair endonuclease
MGTFDDERPGEPWLYGVASRAELLEAGVGRRAIQHRLRSGRYLRLYEGVYAIGHAALTVAGRRRAVVLACGERAVLSHRSAASAWGLRPDGGARWEVTVRKASRVAPNAPVRVYRHPSLRDDEVTGLDGIPVTTVAGTLLDLAAVVSKHHLRRAIEAAEQQQLLDLAPLHRALDAHPRRRGRRNLLALLDDLEHYGVERTRSDVEAAFLQLCLDHHLPRPQVNRTSDGREHDFTWPDQRLVVEIDGYAHHRTRAAFRNDRARDRALLTSGWRVARFTAAEVLTDPATVARELRGVLKLKYASTHVDAAAHR